MRVVRNRLNPLTDSEVRGLTAGPKRSTHALGESLFLVVEPASKGGGKRFVGRYRQPPGRQGKQKEYAIGVYGKKVGQFSLKDAREESGQGCVPGALRTDRTYSTTNTTNGERR